VKEVTLLGQIVNLYGRHEFPRIDSKSPFVQLLEAVHEIDGLERLRFTSPHPIGFREDLIGAYRRLPKTGRSPPSAAANRGSNKILKANAPDFIPPRNMSILSGTFAMHGRKSPSRPTSSLVFRMRPKMITNRRALLVEEIKFDNAFVFRYSPRRDNSGGGNGESSR